MDKNPTPLLHRRTPTELSILSFPLKVWVSTLTRVLKWHKARFKKRKRRRNILFYLHRFLYKNTFDSEFSFLQREMMTTEMTSYNDCFSWLKDRKISVSYETVNNIWYSYLHRSFLPTQPLPSVPSQTLFTSTEQQPAVSWVLANGATIWGQEESGVTKSSLERQSSWKSSQTPSWLHYLFSAFFIMRATWTERAALPLQSVQWGRG